MPLETARDAFANHGYAGPMTRKVTDAAMMFSVMAGPDDGLPTGLQIVGRWGAEWDILRLGAALETANPWADTRPPPLG